jgi:large subunit ribosomal protein L31
MRFFAVCEIAAPHSSTELSTGFVDNFRQCPGGLPNRFRGALQHAQGVNVREGLACRARRRYPSRLTQPRTRIMKAAIHPDYKAISVTCSCGNTFETGSTLGHDLQIEVCSSCHPFYTGKQKIVDTGGRVDKFRKKYQMGGAAAR